MQRADVTMQKGCRHLESEYGLKCDPTTLKAWFIWKTRIVSLRHIDAEYKAFKDTKGVKDKVSTRDLAEIGDKHFMEVALATADAKIWTGVRATMVAERRARVAEETLKLERIKWELDVARTVVEMFDELQESIGASGNDRRRMIDSIRAKLFGVKEVRALEQPGHEQQD